MPEVKYRPDHYYLYEELTEYVQALPDRFGEFVSVRSIGESPEGRSLWLVAISNPATGAHDSKPAYWVDGNTHATEVTASSACLHTIEYILENRDDAAIADVLEHTTFYIAPRINPDGAEHFLDTKSYVRSAPRDYPDVDAITTFIEEDIDGDGEVLQMRWQDPTGGWRVSQEDPRLMLPRTPWDTGPFYNLTAEGRFTDEAWANASLPIENVDRFGLDFNRNYPHAWRPESHQKGAGPYPLSEPETRAVVEFLFDHPNICGVLTHHTFSGVLLRPFTDRPDTDMKKFDLQTYELIGERCEELTGYPCKSVFHDFKYDPSGTEGGVFDDWVYEHYGVHAYTMELWDPLTRAGVDMSEGFLRPWIHPTEDDQVKLLAWNDGELKGNGVVEWKEVDHPQIGKVEIGGWRWQFTRRNPPPELLESVTEGAAKFAVAHAQALPRPFLSVDVVPVGDGLFAIDVLVRNDGFLPTYVTHHGKEHIVRDTTLALELEGPELVEGETVTRIKHVEGYSFQTLPRTIGSSTHGRSRADRKSERFIVRGTGTINVRWFGDRIGDHRVEVQVQ